MKKQKSSMINFKFSYFYFFIIVFIFFTIFNSCTNEKIKLEKESFDLSYLPIFISPQQDYTKKNDIIGVSISFIKDEENEKIIEYTILFKDEDHPNRFINFIYDLFRSFKYKRIIDTESFFIGYIKTPDGYWKVNYVDFPDDYGADQVYLEKNVKHFSLKIDGNSFEKKDNRVVIYINTWNHMFSNKDTNINLEKVVIDNYETYSGNRIEVEKQFNKNYKDKKKE